MNVYSGRLIDLSVKPNFAHVVLETRATGCLSAASSRSKHVRSVCCF